MSSDDRIAKKKERGYGKERTSVTESLVTDSLWLETGNGTTHCTEY